MKIYSVVSGPLRVNSYFLVNEKTNKAVVIDAGASNNLLAEVERQTGIKVTANLLTHAHYDHSRNSKKLQELGVKIYISDIDSEKLKDGRHLGGENFPIFTPDYTFKDGDVLEIEGIKIKVILTPGHTDGSATFLVDNSLFTGDTLLRESVGRTDFPSGDYLSLIKSVKGLYALNGDYQVFPGHGEASSLNYERKNNPFIKQDD